MKRPLSVFAAVAVVFQAMVCPATGPVQDLSKLFEETGPSVVTIHVYNKKGNKLGQGSGFFVDKRGIVATGWHVVSAAEVVRLASSDGKEIGVSMIVSADKTWDVALLKADSTSFAPLRMAESGRAKVGMAVAAIGSPLGLDQTLSTGVISGLREKEGHKDLLQVTCAISRGSSGGPVMTTDGKVLGIAQSTSVRGQNINFAVPVRIVRQLLKSMDEKKPERKLSAFTPKVKKAIEGAKALRQKLEKEVSSKDVALIDKTIGEAVSLGAPVYNSGGRAGHLACYRIYEGAAYKMIVKLGGRAGPAKAALEKALKKADDAAGATEKAWIMRRCFDSLLGKRTQGGQR